MRLTVDQGSSVPPYEQVRGQLAAQVGDGRLPVGTRLPPVRQLAAQLDLAVNTVARAYRELEVAGLLETRGRHGTFVAPGRDDARDRLHRSATEYAAETHRLGVPADAALDLVRAALEAGADRHNRAEPAPRHQAGGR